MERPSESSMGPVDVVVIGAGPAGLLTAFGLQKAGISTIVVEREDKSSLSIYGRACTLYPRTIEMLDQYGLLDRMAQVGFIARTSATFNKDGKRVASRGFHGMFDEMGASFLDYVLNIRLKYSEDIFREAYLQAGGRMLGGWELTHLHTRSAASDGFPITASVQNLQNNSTTDLQSKNLVGADGAHSKVRKSVGIVSDRMPVIGAGFKWARIDAAVKTDMPDSEMGFCFIESAAHGNVLWANQDHGKTRIGYRLPTDKAEQVGDRITETMAIEEARKALAPWKLEFGTVDWFSNYDIHQSLAREYIKDRVVLIGDACHTHSSGLAQGMNTGVHDAVNLVWKLAGVIKGWFSGDVLQTYNTERRSAAKYLVELDQNFSTLISGNIPDQFKSWSDNPYIVQERLSAESVQFNIGLGVAYDENLLNCHSAITNVIPGHRAPDALVYKPGSHIPTRIQQTTPNEGSFWVVVFSGEPSMTQDKVATFRSFTDSSEKIRNLERLGILHFVTIVSGNRPQGEAALQGPAFGTLYYDQDGLAYRRYGLSMQSGGVVVLRPDGIFGFACGLNAGADLEEYFSKFVQFDQLAQQ